MQAKKLQKKQSMKQYFPSPLPLGSSGAPRGQPNPLLGREVLSLYRLPLPREGAMHRNSVIVR